jgi:hypothetical protein
MNVKLWSQPLATTKVPRRQENKPPLASFKKILEASNIDQRFVMASRDDAAIIAPFESSRRSTSTNLGMPEILGCQVFRWDPRGSQPTEARRPDAGTA